MKNLDEIRKKLFELAEPGYRDFTKNLIPNLDESLIIGVRVPLTRKLAINISKENPGLAEEYLNVLPHKYYEENNLHGFLIELIDDVDLAIRKTDEFLPYVDNWSTCDIFSPKIFKKHKGIIYDKALEWVNSGDTYVVRYGIGMLMTHFLDEEFKPEAIEIVSKIRSEEYYINMMIAWYFATALAKNYDETISYLNRRVLMPWTHNKAIQKAIESRRVPIRLKGELRKLKIKNR
ncbi:DNA alkylation repair protein [Microaceticoccus formicicus]|uniref:DNA alkylation repair protein n=1 Tax=Microaceticoccus formicicus TaxID=3118105 RepID=UPI003CD01963|nr:DNA alkylation repair protein [Peptoniphilaceae bacterium AMB_02]